MPVYFRMMRYSGMYYFSRSRVRGSGSGSAAGLGPWPLRDREKEQHINIERDLVPGAQGDPGPGAQILTRTRGRIQLVGAFD